jgi:hypothetical protein
MGAGHQAGVDGIPMSAGAGRAVVQPTAWDRARRWRPTRRGIAVGLLLVVALVVLALAAPPRTGDLDPAAVDAGGSRAVATILRDQGVLVTDVRLTRDAEANARGATVLVTAPALPTEAMVDDLLAAGPGRVVLVEPVPRTAAFERLAAGIALADAGDDDPLDPRCSLRAAEQAGSAALPGLRYDARAWTGSGQACYDRPGAAAVVVLPARPGRPEVVLLGSAHPLTNDGLDEEGNAALALGLLGADERLVWWRPTIADPALAGRAPTSASDLLPPWVLPVVVQVLVACLLVAWWRGRRMGPLVVEPLPVVVRAGETTAGRARLLHAHHARGEAAEHLRAAARERVRVRLGLPVGCPPEALVRATAQRTGRPSAQVGALLYGPEPADDTGLVRLEHDLGTLDVEVGGA